jgi:hypothetical protein
VINVVRRSTKNQIIIFVFCGDISFNEIPDEFSVKADEPVESGLVRLIDSSNAYVFCNTKCFTDFIKDNV